MKKIALAAMLFAASQGFCQPPAKENDTLQSLLSEVRQVRQAIAGMTVASQRVQIALYALQMQESAVTHSAQRVDIARNSCSGAEVKRGHTAAAIQQLENSLASGSLAEAETKAIQSVLSQKKNEIEADTMALQTCQATESEASSQLRNDQAKLVELEDRIERLDKVLEKLGTGK